MYSFFQHNVSTTQHCFRYDLRRFHRENDERTGFRIQGERHHEVYRGRGRVRVRGSSDSGGETRWNPASEISR